MESANIQTTIECFAFCTITSRLRQTYLNLKLVTINFLSV